MRSVETTDWDELEGPFADRMVVALALRYRTRSAAG